MNPNNVRQEEEETTDRTEEIGGDRTEEEEDDDGGTSPPASPTTSSVLPRKKLAPCRQNLPRRLEATLTRPHKFDSVKWVGG
jgi:hypothetical protein